MYAEIHVTRSDDKEYIFSEADFPKVNQIDVLLALNYCYKRRKESSKKRATLKRIRQYAIQMLHDFSCDYELARYKEDKTVDLPTQVIPSSITNPQPGQVSRSPQGIVFKEDEKLKFFWIKEKHLYSDSSLSKIVDLIKNAGSKHLDTQIAMLEKIAWMFSFRENMEKFIEILLLDPET